MHIASLLPDRRVDRPGFEAPGHVARLTSSLVGWEMHILVASSSAFRQCMYRDAIESLAHQVSVVSGGVECLAQIHAQRPDLLILEAPLFWGGAEGVLHIL